MPNATKQTLRAALEKEVRTKPWCQDEDRFNLAMQAVDKTLNGHYTCALDSVWINAWKEIGCKGKPTYKAIHALNES